MASLTVAAGLAWGLMDLAVSRGASQQALSAQSGIDPGTLLDQDFRVPFSQYMALMKAGQTLCGDPALALHYGETNDLSQISIVGLLGSASETLSDAMVQLNRYGRLVVEFDGPGDRFQTVSDHGLWVVDTRQNPSEFPELTESTFARLVCGARRFGVQNLALEVQVTHAAPAYRAEYDRIFQAPVVFESRWNAMRINAAAATHPIALQPRYVFGILSERADALLKDLESARSVRGHVERLLMPILHTGDVKMETIAARMGLTRQTLLRKLKAEGLTFARVLDELRRRLALDYLNAKKVSVNEAAYLVGFSEPAAFSRAFKRWTGVSPRAARAVSRNAIHAIVAERTGWKP